MNLKQAKQLKQGDLVYHVSKKNADGSKMRAKVTSVRTWKRDLTRIEIGLKHGLYDFAKFNEFEIKLLTLKD